MSRAASAPPRRRVRSGCTRAGRLPKTRSMATPDARLKELLAPERPDPAAVREFLDGLDHSGRMTAVTSLQGIGHQAKLYEIAKSAPPITLEELVPRDLPPLREV